MVTVKHRHPALIQTTGSALTTYLLPRWLCGAGPLTVEGGASRETLKSSQGTPCVCPELLPDASTPTMAETTKLQLFVKVLGRLGWTGCSVFLCRLRGGSS